MAEAGYQIGKRFFPFPTSFRLGDPVLIRELTGMDWDEFIRAMPDEDDPDAIGDPIVMMGLLGVAVWQANPTWRRDKVARFVQGINIEEVEAIGGEEDEDEVPLEEEASKKKAGSKASGKQNGKSELGSDSLLDQSTQPPSGTPQLLGTPKEQ